MRAPSLPSSVDLAVLGGGITGAGVAHRAARCGLSVVLFEKDDFASGTSSRSTKLVHGGIRYLEQLRFGLVRESLRERRNLLALAPHLVRPLPFLLPAYAGDRRPAWMLRLGLGLYDLLAGRQNLPPHRWLDSEAAREVAPPLNPLGLKGCGVYWDAQVNDARLVLENVLAAERLGAACLNGSRVESAQVRADGRVDVRFLHEDGGSGVLTAQCLVAAPGPFANRVLAVLPLADSSTPRVRPTRGTHLVVPQVLPSHAVLLSSRRDHRVFFVIPWRGFSLVGTTDVDHFGDPDAVEPTEEEVDYLLEESRRAFPRLEWTRHQVLAAFAGLRPLAFAEREHASSVSREERVTREGPVILVVGGKLTTYRSMAEKVLQEVGRVLGCDVLPASPERFPGAPGEDWKTFLNRRLPDLVGRHGLTPAQASHLLYQYGERYAEVLVLLAENPAWREPLHPDSPEILAEAVLALRDEKARHLEDVMLRRLDAGFSPWRWEAAERVSRLAAEIHGWDEGARRAELDRYRRRLFPPVDAGLEPPSPSA